MRSNRPLPALLAVALLAGCGSAASTPITPSPTAPSTSSAPSWTAKVISLKRVVDGPAAADIDRGTAWGSDVPAGSTLVTVRWTMSNPTTTPVDPLPTSSLTSGPNELPADIEPGIVDHEVMQPDNLPGRIGAGGSVTTWRSWVVPTADLGELRLHLTADDGERVLDVH